MPTKQELERQMEKLNERVLTMEKELSKKEIALKAITLSHLTLVEALQSPDFNRLAPAYNLTDLINPLKEVTHPKPNPQSHAKYKDNRKK